jgi:ATP-dependent exoDNAse (exonuclease V) beta subunit
MIRRNETGEASGVAGKLKQFVDDASTDIVSEQFEEALARNKDDRDRESRRLFYVACTRARDLLVLSGENPFNGNKDAWRSWINRHLLQCDFNPALITLHPYGAVERAWRTIAKPIPEQPIPAPQDFRDLSTASSPKAATERYRFPVTALMSLECGDLPVRRNRGEGGTPLSPALANASSADENQRQAATLQIRLSLAPVGITSANADDLESPEPTTPRAQAGTLAHRILETLDYSGPIPLEDQIDASPEWQDISPASRPSIRKQILSAASTIGHMLSSPLPLGDLSALSGKNSFPLPLPVARPSTLHAPSINHQPLTINHCLREFPFAARFDHDGAQVIVDGKVDLLFFTDNRWHLVDYKFSDHSPEELQAQYANQLFIYREALSVPTNDPKLRTPRFASPDPSPAEWTLTLLAITSGGDCTPITIEGDPRENLSAKLIQSARQLARR